MDYLRDVVAESRFSQDLDNFREKYPQIDDVFMAVSWTLARDPRQGTPLPVAPDFYVFETTPIGNVPAFWILYNFDEQKVYLQSIEPVTESDDEE